jgi:hypothetical protein
MKRTRVFAGIVGAALVGTFTAAVALGSPPSGLTPTNLVTANFEHTVVTNSDRVKFQTKDSTDVRIQRLEFAAGSSSGWHHHPGIVIVTIEQGSVTLWQADCTGTTYGPGLPDGNVFVEGGDEPVQATSTDGATNYVVFVAPDANPPVFRIEDDPPPCAS